MLSTALAQYGGYPGAGMGRSFQGPYTSGSPFLGGGMGGGQGSPFGFPPTGIFGNVVSPSDGSYLYGPSGGYGGGYGGNYGGYGGHGRSPFGSSGYAGVYNPYAYEAFALKKH
ncbi:hypothetical protein AAVH_17826 [Aphelenchoides avenae]|nr:hypothetical protein AAVH_17826 [Aphelenchus avenae]